MGANLSVNEEGLLFSARVHKVKNLAEETHDSIGRKQSASCRRSKFGGSMACGAVRCRKMGEAKRRWNQCSGRARLEVILQQEEKSGSVTTSDAGNLQVAGQQRPAAGRERLDTGYQ